MKIGNHDTVQIEVSILLQKTAITLLPERLPIADNTITLTLYQYQQVTLHSEVLNF